MTRAAPGAEPVAARRPNATLSARALLRGSYIQFFKTFRKVVIVDLCLVELYSSTAQSALVQFDGSFFVDCGLSEKYVPAAFNGGEPKRYCSEILDQYLTKVHPSSILYGYFAELDDATRSYCGMVEKDPTTVGYGGFNETNASAFCNFRPAESYAPTASDS